MSEVSNSASVPTGNPEGGAPAEGGENASSDMLGRLSKTIGRDFPDEATALDAIKETFNYVGSVGQLKKKILSLKDQGISEEEVFNRVEQLGQSTTAAPRNDVQSEINALKQRLDETTFYSENPDLKEYQGFLSEIQADTGRSLSQIVESDSFKTVLEKAKGYDASQKSKSVLESSPRLGRVKDKMTEAREASKAGNQVGANKSAIGAVLDAYDMK
jgi:hypothetical protein